MCIEINWVIAEGAGIHLTWGNGLTLTGQVFTLIGLVLVTLSGIFGEKPVRRLYHLMRNIDREELDGERDKTFDLALVPTSEKTPDNPSSTGPVTKADYDALKRRLVRGISGAFFLITGIVFQMGGVLVC